MALVLFPKLVSIAVLFHFVCREVDLAALVIVNGENRLRSWVGTATPKSRLLKIRKGPVRGRGRAAFPGRFKGYFDGFFQLRIVAGPPHFGIEIDVNIRADAFVFDVELALGVSERNARGRDSAAVDKRRIAVNADEPAPCTTANERSDLCLSEKPRHKIAAAAGVLVDDHCLWAVDGTDRRCKIVALAG